MKKITVVILVFAVLLAGGYYFYQNQAEADPNSTATAIKNTPERPAEINGIISSALGNEIKLAKEIDRVTLTQEEQTAKKAAMQELSPEEKAALKAEESANLKTEEVSLLIPVGISISKGTGDASGNIISADIAELKKGVYISVWTNEKNEIEHIKIKGI